MDFVTIALMIAAVWIGVLVVVVLAIFKASGHADADAERHLAEVRDDVSHLSPASQSDATVGDERRSIDAAELEREAAVGRRAARAATHAPATSAWNSSPPFTTVTVGSVDRSSHRSRLLDRAKGSSLAGAQARRRDCSNGTIASILPSACGSAGRTCGIVQERAFGGARPGTCRLPQRARRGSQVGCAGRPRLAPYGVSALTSSAATRTSLM